MSSRWFDRAGAVGHSRVDRVVLNQLADNSFESVAQGWRAKGLLDRVGQAFWLW